MEPDGIRRTLTVEEAAVFIGIGRRFAYELARRGELPGVFWLGSKYLVSRAALEAYLSEAGKQLADA